MEDVLVLNKRRRGSVNEENPDTDQDRPMGEKPVFNTAIDDLIAEGGESFLHYMNRLGLTDESNLLVLPAKNHYYYDDSELKSVTTLVNVRKLNLIKHLDSFLHNVSRVMSPDANFIGCFSEKGPQKGIKIFSRMYKGFINILDSRTDNEIDRNNFTRMVESNGFQVTDLTTIDGLTFFRTQSNRSCSSSKS